MIETGRLTIPPLSGRKRRRYYVYVPDSALEDDTLRYPVLYMFDGHNVFFDEDATYGKSWGMGEYLDFTGAQVIVAAVECNHGPDNARLKEYSPFDFDDPQLGHVEGLGKITMDWFSGAFKRRIDRAYPTLPDRDHTWIAGSSMGGLMSLYALACYPEVYGRAAALSPSLWVARDRVTGMIRDAAFPHPSVLYMDYGENEMGRRGSAMSAVFRKTADLLLRKGVLLTSRIVPDGEHCEASWEEQLPFMMETLLYERMY